MSIFLSTEICNRIHAYAEKSYPDEGAGLILGINQNGDKHLFELLWFANARENSARRNSYLLTPHDYLAGELEAERLGLEVVGMFHSHPDHPDQPSDFDREWAIPSLSYIIISIWQGSAVSSRSWKLDSDRNRFTEEPILITNSRTDQPVTY